MKITPKSDSEISQAGLIPAGIYDFEILEATEGQSKKGNDMITLKLKVFVDDAERIVFDYLVDGVMEHKIKHLCSAVGLEANYNEGSVDAELFEGKCGKVSIIIQKSKDIQYDDRNSVKDYIVDGKGVELDDSLPF